VNGILGTKAPKLGHDGWRAFHTQQHGDNPTIELLVGGRQNDGNDDGDNDR